MEINQAYQTIKRYFSKLNIEGRETKYVVESAEKSWMMPLPWFFAATAHARDDDKEEFRDALNAASACYGEILSRRDPEELKEETKMTKEAEAADTLARNVEEAWKLVIVEL